MPAGISGDDSASNGLSKAEAVRSWTRPESAVPREEAGGRAGHVGRPGRQIEAAPLAPLAAFEVVEPFQRIVVFDVAGAGLAQDRALQVTQAPGGRRVIVIVLLFRDRRLLGPPRTGSGRAAVRQDAAARGDLSERGAGGHDARLLRQHRGGQLAELHHVARAARGHHMKEFAFGGGEPASLDAHQVGAGRNAVEREVTGPIGLGQQEIAPLRGDGGAEIGRATSSVTWPSIQPEVRDAVCDTAEAVEAAEAETVGMISSGPIVLVRVVWPAARAGAPTTAVNATRRRNPAIMMRTSRGGSTRKAADRLSGPSTFGPARTGHPAFCSISAQPSSHLMRS